MRWIALWSRVDGVCLLEKIRCYQRIKESGENCHIDTRENTHKVIEEMAYNEAPSMVEAAHSLQSIWRVSEGQRSGDICPKGTEVASNSNLHCSEVVNITRV